MPAATPRQPQYEIELPAVGFDNTMLVNQFNVELAGDNVLVHFAFVNAVGFTMDVRTFGAPLATLRPQSTKLLEYAGQVGIDQRGALPPWTPPLTHRPVVAFSLIQVSRTAATAEIILGIYSLHYLLTQQRKSGSSHVPAQQLSLLMCSVALQLDFLLSLCEKLDPEKDDKHD